MDVAVTPGNTHHAKHAAPGLWGLLERLGRENWPALLRGDADWGTEANMSRAEQEGLPYLFKMRATAKVKRLIAKLTGGHGEGGASPESASTLSAVTRSISSSSARR